MIGWEPHPKLGELRRVRVRLAGEGRLDVREPLQQRAHFERALGRRRGLAHELPGAALVVAAAPAAAVHLR